MAGMWGWVSVSHTNVRICWSFWDTVSLFKMSDDRLPIIDKLQASNWTIWKMQLMKARKLWKLCLGMETLSPQATAQQVEDLEVRIVCVLFILGQTIGSEERAAKMRSSWTHAVGHWTSITFATGTRSSNFFLNYFGSVQVSEQVQDQRHFIAADSLGRRSP